MYIRKPTLSGSILHTVFAGWLIICVFINHSMRQLEDESVFLIVVQEAVSLL